MIPTIALIGRPNVGKSTLFNHLTRSRDALVADYPGLTRDRKYGLGHLDAQSYIVIDTGGLASEAEGVDELARQQSLKAIEEADCVFFLVDGRAGLNADDSAIAAQLRRQSKPVYLLVNKTDGLNPEIACTEFYELALGEPWAVSATQGRNLNALLRQALASVTGSAEPAPAQEAGHIAIAVIGRPNVGKSTLINRILGEERLVAYDQPGTTRDTVEVPFSVQGRDYLLIDTAGVRRKSRTREAVEKFSVLKAIKAIEHAQVAILVIDAREGITDQDLVLLSYVLDAGRALLIAFNKWDGLETGQREQVKSEIQRRLGFVDYAEMHFISALHGTGVGHLLGAVDKAYEAAMADLKTSQLTDLLAHAVNAHPPPLVRGRRIKLRYAHQGGKNPPLIVVHGNQVHAVPAAYTRYLVNTFRKKLRLRGTPLRIEYRSGENPYKDRKNKLTGRQVTRRKRLMKWVKRNKNKN